MVLERCIISSSFLGNLDEQSVSPEKFTAALARFLNMAGERLVTVTKVFQRTDGGLCEKRTTYVGGILQRAAR